MLPILFAIAGLSMMVILGYSVRRQNINKINLFEALRTEVQNSPQTLQILQELKTSPTKRHLRAAHEEIKRLIIKWSSDDMKIIWDELNGLSEPELATILIGLLDRPVVIQENKPDSSHLQLPPPTPTAPLEVIPEPAKEPVEVPQKGK